VTQTQLAGGPGRGGSIAAARPVGIWAFLGVTIASFGGPLALAALYVPTILTHTATESGLVLAASAVAFAVPLFVWVRYAQHVSGPGGLAGYVEAAAGRPLALVQSALWITSYALYLLYTTAFVVYDTLPVVLPGVRAYRSTLEIVIPVVLAGIMLAGRSVMLATLGLLAAAQLVLVGALAWVGFEHGSAAHAFTQHGGTGPLSTATAQTALLYICGSLPVFLGGEVRAPLRTIPRGLVGGYVLVAAAVGAAVLPIAANPAFTHADIPGVAIAQVFSSHGLAVAIGVGVAASTVGVMLVEYVALTRLGHWLTGRSYREVAAVLAVLLVGFAPVTLVDPDRIYDDLLKPSLVTLWLSQAVVFAVYPLFTRRFTRSRPVDVAVAALGVAFTGYGIYASLTSGGGT
jgi:amino acid transporter